MGRLGNRPRSRDALRWIAWLGVASAGAGGLIAGCGGDTTETAAAGTTTGAPATTTTTGSGGGTTSASSSKSASTGAGGTTASTTGSGGAGAGGAGTGGAGGGPICGTAATGATRGSALAVSPDDSRIVSVNRDAGSVTVMSVDYGDGQPKMTKVSEVAVGGEPWQVVIDGCGKKAYVVLRLDQKVVEIDGIDTATPTKGKEVAVGSEPTSLALTPNNTKLYVSNWVDGTLSVIDPAAMTVTGTVDLNATLAATGVLGNVTSRPSLAHPRGIAITNNGDAMDSDETLLVTEWFAARTGPEDANGTNSDHNWKGLVYKVKVADDTATTIDLPAISDTKFKDAKNQSTGCFPNQVASVTIDAGFAYVTSTCASPVGPLGVTQAGACINDSQCGGIPGACVGGSCKGTCATDAQCGANGGSCDLVNGGACKPNTVGVKTTTHPAVSVINLAASTATTANLDTILDVKGSKRMPLLPTDIAFINGFGYLTAEGADAAFRLIITNGVITDIGSPSNLFIDMRTTDTTIRLPIGIQTAHLNAFGFVANDGSRDVTAVNFNAQAVAGNAAMNDFRVTSSSDLPMANSPEDQQLRGKRFFNTGLGRWSLAGGAWGSCGACHIDGLTDNVTWYFARGPRQTTSLDGSYASKDATDQRILNWTAINDEIADFEGNVRGVSGGVGAMVTVANTPPTVADRINLTTQVPPQLGLQGSSNNIADTTNKLMDAHTHTVIGDWNNITSWVQTIRSPRKPTNLVPADVTAGKTLFGVGQGNCVGCHSGAKWTISKVFYTPGDIANDLDLPPTGAAKSLSTETWNTALNGFPAALFPASVAANQKMRFGAPPGAEQIQCILRPIGTILPPPGVGQPPTGVSDKVAVNVLEIRTDMVTGAQGAADPGLGFNPPSLLGTQVGAPFYHAGNARTLEEAFDSTLFKTHYQSAVANIFNPTPADVNHLVAYLLSIDESEPTVAIPAKGATGGDICFHVP